MTEQEIDAMEAGAWMNWLIADKAFGGWEPLTPEEAQTALEHGMIPDYSTDIAAAWLVVEKIREEEWWSVYGGDLFIEDWRDGKWTVCSRDILSRKKTGYPVFYAEAETMPLAICRAALKAVLSK